MKRAFMYVVLLAAGVAVSAWLGIADAKIAAEHKPAAPLNSKTRSAGLREGEILIWAPNPKGGQSQTPPPSVVTARAAPSPIAAPQVVAAPAPRRQAAVPGQAYYQATRDLIPLAKQLQGPRAGGRQNEPEQDFGQFAAEARQGVGVLIIQPIGELSNDQRRAIGHLLDAFSAFFGLPTQCAAPIPLESIPSRCFRTTNGYPQLNAEMLMDLVLRPRIENRGAIIAISEMDLCPGEKWTYSAERGWASHKDGTAVLSTLQVLDDSQADRGRNLLRLTKLSVHELCHAFNLKHCGRYVCLLNGLADLDASDAVPLALCPDCLAKLSLATERRPAMHVEDMLGLCRAKGFAWEERYYSRALQLMK